MSSTHRVLVAAIVAEAFADAPPIVPLLIASAFATRLLEARQDDDLREVADWAELTCERYGHIVNVTTMLLAACGVAREVLGRRNLVGASLENGLRLLAISIAASVARIVAARTTSEVGNEEIDATIAASLHQLDGADPLSAEHSRAVSLWCRRLARRLALPEEQCIFVARGGMLHDIGKTTTPASILLAARGLSDDEYAIMREHASVGGELARAVEHLQPFVPLVRNHHERIDGDGYPDHLRGSEISQHVRIVAVADCFNAMIGRRPYRPPMSPATALEQLVKHKGTQFDPLVVEAMIDVIEHPDL